MIKKLQIITLIILLVYGGLVVYGKSKIKHLEYDEYVATKSYLTTEGENETLEFAPYLKDIILDSKVNGYDDLFNNSPTVLKITVDSVNFAGEGMINNCTIKDVIKGDSLKEGDKISIYDYIYFISYVCPTYELGARPLKVGDTYVVFVDNAPNPNVDGSYIFTSFKYGSFRLKEQPNYLVKENINEADLLMKDAMEYDYLCQDGNIALYDSIFRKVNDLHK